MKTQHTPGPWAVDAEDRVTVFSEHLAICTCTSDVVPDITVPRTEQKANARLIATAPDLLAALQDALNAVEYMHEHEGFPDTLREVRAAIAKATGGA